MKGEYREWAFRHLNVKLDSGSELMTMCVFHDSSSGSATMQFNVDKGFFVCFSCGEGGGMKKLTRHLGLRFQEGDIDINDLIDRINSIRHKGKDSEVLPVRPESMLERYRIPTDYWGTCSEGFQVEGCTGRIGCKHHRWLSQEIIESFDLGYDMVDDAAIIPLRNHNGGLIGTIKRYLGPDIDVRYRYPKKFKRGSALFGSWLVEYDDSDMAVLTEGSIDAMWVWQAGYMGLGQYGSSITKEQIRLLLRLGIRRVVLFYDNDAAGTKATEWAHGFKRRVHEGKTRWEYDPELDLRKHFFVSSVDWSGTKKKDPNSLPLDDVRSMIDLAKRDHLKFT